MKQYIPVLKRTRLFAGVGEEDIAAMLTCLGAELHLYKRGAYVFRQGEYLEHITMLAEGRLHIQRDDYWGNRSIVAQVEAGEMFGESYAASGSGALLNDVVAQEASAVLFFDVNKLLGVCPSACRFHTLVVRNLFLVLSEKNQMLVRKLGHMSKRTTREKLLSYLSEEAGRQNSGTFEIPFNRQQLADFLSVDRSAMSNELSRMRDEGLLSFDRNKFTLLAIR